MSCLPSGSDCEAKLNKTVKVITDDHRWWKGEAIPTMSNTKLSKYLGVKLNPIGEVTIPWDLWDTWLATPDEVPISEVRFKTVQDKTKETNKFLGYDTN